MKNIIACLVLFSSVSFMKSGNYSIAPAFLIRNSIQLNNTAGNLIIITIDGLRWHEVFKGADESLINDLKYTRDTATSRMLYWADSEKERRQELMPFFWSVLAQKGQLFGNRKFGNKVNTSNIYNTSYPGYNEMFTGNTDLLIHSNRKNRNVHQNVLEYLNKKDEFKGRVVAFTSWDVFPYILNEDRSGLLVNSGYEEMAEGVDSGGVAILNDVQSDSMFNKEAPRYDELTFIMAREYLQRRHPKVVLLGLGETDEHAHHERYDLYLQQVNKIDRMLAELWQWIQTTPGYNDNTTLLITTDHGRGNKKWWASHGSFIRGSSDTWLALMGPRIQPLGEVKDEQQLFLYELAEMIAGLVGEEFEQAVAGSR